MTELVQQQRMPASDARSEKRPRREMSISEPRGVYEQDDRKKVPCGKTGEVCMWLA